MKCTVNRHLLAEAFAIASPVAAKSNPREIMQYLMLTADDSDGPGTLIATDTECSIALDVDEVATITPGDVLLHVARAGQILRECSDERLTLSTDGDKLTIEGNHSQFTLTTPSVAEFPKPDFSAGASGNPDCTLTAATLRQLLQRTGFCTDDDSTRFALSGVLLEVDGRPGDREVRAVATDGRRLALARGQNLTSSPQADTNPPLVPPTALTMIGRLIDRSHRPEAEVQLRYDAMTITVTTATATIRSPQLAGRFPRWQQVVPDDIDQFLQADINAGPIVSAIRQAAIVADSESRAIDLTISGGMLALSAAAADVGASRIELPIQLATKPEGFRKITVRLDHRYLLECCRVLPPDTLCHLHIRSATQPVIITTDDGSLWLIMPQTK